jgi:hypothetical protein
MNCSSLVVPLCTFSSLVTSFNSGHCTKLAAFQFVYSDRLLYFVIGQWAGFLSFSLPLLKNFSTTNTMQRSKTIIKISFNHGAAEELPACCGTTGPGVEKREASLPTLKAAAENPEGSFTPAAAEAGLEVGGGAPVMTEAVGPLVTAEVGKTRPPACTSRQLAGSTDRLWARRKSIPRMAVETSASKKFQVKC